jgi:LemA protein
MKAAAIRAKTGDSELAQVLHADQDKPTFSTPDGSPVHRRPRTDFSTLRGSLRV